MGYKKKPGDVSLIELNVPYVAQKRQQSCWYACAKMLYKYCHGENAKVKHEITKSKEGAAVHLHMQKSGKIGEEEEGVGATEKEWPTIAAAFGLTPLSKVEFNLLDQSADVLVGILKTYGPLWCAGRFFQGGSEGGHVIVATGVITRKVLQTTSHWVIFHDPAPEGLQGGPYCVKQFNNYFKLGGKKNGLFNLTETENVVPVMYITSKQTKDEGKKE